MAAENDLVLIYFENQPLTYARIESILTDHKPGWYHVKLLLLQVPLQIITWILRDVYIDGAEFAMNGKRMRLEKVVVPQEPSSSESTKPPIETPQPAKDSGRAKVISLTDLKKK